MVDFLRGNPVRQGVHWMSAMETALRLFSWMQSDRLLADYWPDLRSEPFCFGIPLHAAELARTLTTDLPVPNNHLLVEAAALDVVGQLYANLPGSDRWRRRGREILLEQLDRQTHDDGINREASPAYQRFVTEAVLLWWRVGRSTLAARGVAAWLLKNLRALVALRPPNDRWPMLADSDGGKVLRWDLSRPFWDFSAVVHASATVLRRPPSREWVETPEGCLLAGPEDAVARSRDCGWATGSSGIRVHRLGAAHLIVRGGELGLGGEGYSGHAHCDLGSLHLWLQRTPLLEDTGTLSYNGTDSGGWFAYRRSDAHCVVRVGREEQFTPVHPFNNVRLWRCEWLDFGEAEGHLRMSSPDGQIAWERRYVLRPDGLQVIDTCNSDEWASSFLPLGRGWQASEEGAVWRLRHRDVSIPVRLQCDVPGELDEVPIHPEYGTSQSRSRWRASFRKTLTWSLTWN
jgi:hypothetical protein